MDLDLSDIPGVSFSKPEAMLAQSSIVLYGMPGCGKTTLAATAVEVPELSPVLFLDCENSTAAIATKYPDHPHIDVVQIRDWRSGVRVIDKVFTQPHKYKTVVIDPINGLAQFLQIEMRRRVARKIELARNDRRTAREEAEFSALSKVKIPENTNNSMGEPGTTEPDYGIIGDEIISLAARANAAPFLVIMNTHAQEYSSRTQTREVLRPDMPGNVGRRAIAQKPHLVGFMDTVTETDQAGNVTDEMFRIRFRPGKVGSMNFEAKGRVGPAGKFIANPTMPKLWAIMNDTHVKQ